jgi:hypothetical protein
MVTMVYDQTDLSAALARARRQMAGHKYAGARAFTFWANAVAYALLPPAPGFGGPGMRRLVLKGESGRWIAGPTSAPRRVRPGMVSW